MQGGGEVYLFEAMSLVRWTRLFALMQQTCCLLLISTVPLWAFGTGWCNFHTSAGVSHACEPLPSL